MSNRHSRGDQDSCAPCAPGKLVDQPLYRLCAIDLHGHRRTVRRRHSEPRRFHVDRPAFYRGDGDFDRGLVDLPEGDFSRHGQPVHRTAS